MAYIIKSGTRATKETVRGRLDGTESWSNPSFYDYEFKLRVTPEYIDGGDNRAYELRLSRAEARATVRGLSRMLANHEYVTRTVERVSRYSDSVTNLLALSYAHDKSVAKVVGVFVMDAVHQYCADHGLTFKEEFGVLTFYKPTP
jgi:hypothetical protein